MIFSLVPKLDVGTHVRTLHVPSREGADVTQRRRLEAEVAELVNAAYGLTAEEIALLWRTAPPRMPCEAPTA